MDSTSSLPCRKINCRNACYTAVCSPHRYRMLHLPAAVKATDRQELRANCGATFGAAPPVFNFRSASPLIQPDPTPNTHCLDCNSNNSGDKMDFLKKMKLLDASAVEWWLPASYVILVGLADVVRRCRKGSKSSQASEDPLRAPLLDGTLHTASSRFSSTTVSYLVQSDAFDSAHSSTPAASLRVLKQNNDGLGYVCTCCTRI